MHLRNRFDWSLNEIDGSEDHTWGRICFILSVSFFVKGEIFDCIVALKVLSVARNNDLTAKHPIKHRDND